MAEHIWIVARAHLDKINHNDIRFMEIMNEAREYIEKRIRTNK